MTQIDIHEAKTHLSQLLASRCFRGGYCHREGWQTDSATCTRRRTTSRDRILGQDEGLFTVPEDFNDPLPEDILSAFEGGID